MFIKALLVYLSFVGVSFIFQFGVAGSQERFQAVKSPQHQMSDKGATKNLYTMKPDSVTLFTSVFTLYKTVLYLPSGANLYLGLDCLFFKPQHSSVPTLAGQNAPAGLLPLRNVLG